MKTTIDRGGRIELNAQLQSTLGVQHGDNVVVEARGDELVLKAANGKTGICYEGIVVVHRGTPLPVAAEEADLLADTGAIRLPPRGLRTLKAKVVPRP